jgi:hypothetical protein
VHNNADCPATVCWCSADVAGQTWCDVGTECVPCFSGVELSKQACVVRADGNLKVEINVFSGFQPLRMHMLHYVALSTVDKRSTLSTVDLALS